MSMPLILGLFGLIIGSFLNVLILRRGARGLSGRSSCMSCGTTIRWYDNIPVLSWVLLVGRCRACGSAVSLQYPLVEISTALLFAALGAAELPGFQLLLSCRVVSILVAIAVYDVHHTIIPDSWAYSFTALAALYAYISFTPLDESFLVFFLGPTVTALPLFLMWLVSRGKWMGLGDAKLALGIGWLLGPLYGFVAIMLAFIIGAAISLPLLALSSDSWKRMVASLTPTSVFRRIRGGFTMKSEVAFGPFLIVACLFVWLSILYDFHIPLMLL